ncbi:MAG: hypothetical protein U9P71_03420 [Campylobacterota bacterium]|nr:hypothetical protein [Campylobacterota bacterium]
MLRLIIGLILLYTTLLSAVSSGTLKPIVQAGFKSETEVVQSGSINTRLSYGEGCIVGDCDYGYGYYFYSNGDAAIGKWGPDGSGNFPLDGVGVYVSIDYGLAAHWSNMVPSFGVLSWSDTKKYIGNFALDSDGYWVVEGMGFYVNGTTTEYGAFDDGDFVGDGCKIYYANMLRASSSCEGSCTDGIGLKSYSDGSFYIGDFIDSQYNGYGVYKKSDGTIVAGKWFAHSISEGYQYSSSSQEARMIVGNRGYMIDKDGALQEYTTQWSLLGEYCDLHPSGSDLVPTEDILSSNLSTLKNRLISTKTYNVSGSFAPYNFAGVDDAFDWTFVTPTDVVYQLQGIAPSANDAFGWKKVTVNPSTPSWYMSYLGDWDSDGNGKYDWILVGNGFDAVYKLEGVTATGNFAYSQKIDIEYSVSSDKKTITFGTGTVDEPSDENLPGSVVERALKAQVNENVNDFLAECDFSDYSSKVQTTTRELLNVVKSNASFTNFDFSHRVAAIDAKGTSAIVRTEVSFSIQTTDGKNQVNQGVMTTLKKVNGTWKIKRMGTDELLNRELSEENVSGASPLRKAVVDINKLNEQLDLLLKQGHFDGEKIAIETTAAGIGAIPVSGDVAAFIIEGALTGADASEFISEVRGNGLTWIGVLKAAEVGVGIAQMFTEAVPGFDNIVDVVGLELGQFTHSMGVRRDLYKIKEFLQEIPKGSVSLNPYLFLYDSYAFLYPGGFETDTMKPEVQHSFGTPLGEIHITNPTAFDELIPLRVVGEIPIDGTSPLADTFKSFGAKQRGNTLYFPVDVGYLVESDASLNDQIFDSFSLYTLSSASTKLPGWNVTCRRGMQELSITLKNGEKTPPVEVWSDIMNDVDELMIPTIDDTITVKASENISNLHVLGKGELIEERFRPDLTNRKECLDMAIADKHIATLNRGDTLAVNAIEKGNTLLHLLLIGSSVLQYEEIDKYVAINVCSDGNTIIDGKCEEKTTNTWSGWPNPQWCPRTNPSNNLQYELDKGNYKIDCNYFAGGSQGTLDREIPHKGEIYIDGGYEINYANRDGYAKQYGTDGKLLQTLLFKEGELLKQDTYFYPTEELKEEVPFKGGEIDGAVKVWYENGNQKSEHGFVQGYPNGNAFEWCENGTLNLEASYNNGRLHGIEKRWSCNGVLESCNVYNQGVQVDTCALSN